MTRRVQRWTGWAALAMALTGSARAQTTPEGAASHTATASQWSLELSAEVGTGSRDFDLPMDGVVYRTQTGMFPAAGLGFELDHTASDDISLGLLVRYQSSIVHGIVEQHTDGSEHPLDVRSLRLELAFAPQLRLDGSGDWVLAASAGYGLSDFRPEAHHLVTPAYSLAGPHLRLELQLANLFDVIRLRVGPEVHWIVDVGRDLIDRGMAEQGVGLGGEAGIDILLGRRFMIQATYREMRSWLDSSQTDSFQDVTRFMTVRVSGRL
jgi:hypothetical protein